MKHLFITFITAAFFASCGGNSTETTEATEQQDVAQATEMATTLSVDTESSVINWTGNKALGKTHYGTISLSSGNVTLENGSITSGNFIIDMNSIVDLDLEDEESNAKLTGHLKSDDFFNVAEYPEAMFEITNVESISDDQGNTHSISGNLEIRGVSKNISFPAKVNSTNDALTATATVSINRLDWGINFDKDKATSFADKVVKNAKDDFVNNAIKLEINLIAK